MIERRSKELRPWRFRHDLVIISDEIYEKVLYDGVDTSASPH